MKSLITVVLLLVINCGVPSSALSQWPIRLPSTVELAINARTEIRTDWSDGTSELRTDSNIYRGSMELADITPSGDSCASIVADTMWFAEQQTSRTNKAKFVFDPVTSTLSQIELNINSWAVYLSNFHYDSTSIWCSDSSYNLHCDSVVYTYFNFGGVGGGGHHPLFTETGRLINLNWIDLGGIFKPLHLAKSSVAVIPRQPGLRAWSSRSRIECSAISSAHTRTLELYTPMGITNSKVQLEAGQTDALFQQISAGIYFIRLDDEIIKVLVPE